MTLFTTLLVLIVERLFKLGEHWHLDHRLEVLFRRTTHFSMVRNVGDDDCCDGGDVPAAACAGRFTV